MTNLEEVKEQFCSDLKYTIKRVSTDDRLIFIGDFNADTEKWKVVLGSHRVGKCNTSEELLLALCSECALFINNTIFKHEETHKNTWMHSRSKHWHMLDNIIVRRRDVNEIRDTRAMRGADCGTWDIMLRFRTMIKKKDAAQKV